MLLAIPTSLHKKSNSVSNQIDFLERLARLLSKQYTMKQALEFMRYDPQLNQIANTFTTLLKKGHSIDDCFRLLAFQPLVISFMQITSESGHMSEHIMNCNRMLKMKQHLQKKLTDVLRYPLLLTLISLIIFISINIYLMPMFKNTFASFGGTETLKTIQLIMTMMNILFIIIVISLSLLLITLVLIRQLPLTQKLELIQKIPHIRYFYRLILSMQLSYQLYALLESGKTVKEALQLLKTQDELKIIQYYANEILNQLSKGESLYQSMNNLSLIQSEMKWLVKRSDEADTLTQDLQNYAYILIDSIEDKTKKIILTIQPISYLIIGILIVTIYVLTLYPVYQLMQQI